MVEHLESSLIQVRSVPVKTTAIPLTELRVPTAKVVEIQSTEASLRLDAIASAGFRISRSKMSDMIKGGDVRLNWKSGAKTSVDVAQGDVISCSGKGRVEVKNITLTKKGKYSVEMVRYV
jgi:RNA-binding protein YlmH